MPNLFFSLPIVIGIIAGILFPFKAMELIHLSNSILFLIIFANGLVAEGKGFLTWPKQPLRNSLLFIGLLYVIFPAIFTNFAFLLLDDENYRLGMIFSCIAPTAFVAPYFCKVRGGNSATAVFYILLSTLVFPAVTYVFGKLFFSSRHYVDINSILLLVFLVTIAPLILSSATNRLFPVVRTKLLPYQGWINPLLLALLMFILCGSSFNRVRLSHLLEPQMISIIILLLVLDFGVYGILKWLFDETMAISVSLRNLAIPAGLLLSLQPKAAIVPCIGLIIHSLFFQWLSRKRSV